MPYPWGRLYGEWGGDLKIQAMSEAYQRRHIMLVCMHINGFTSPTDEQAAFYMRISPEEWQATKKVFQENDFLDGGTNHFRAWDARQFKSDSSAERTEKWRKNKRHRDVTVTSLGCHMERHGDGPDTDTDTEKRKSLCSDSSLEDSGRSEPYASVISSPVSDSSSGEEEESVSGYTGDAPGNRPGRSKRGESVPKAERGETPEDYHRRYIAWATERLKAIKAAQHETWLAAYPAVDIDREIAAALAWLAGNITRRKKNLARFISSWLSRSQERGPARARDGPLYLTKAAREQKATIDAVQSLLAKIDAAEAAEEESPI